MNSNNVANIVFYKRYVNGEERRAACIFGKDGRVKYVSYKEGVQACARLAKELHITSKDSFKEMINKDLIHVVKYEDLQKNFTNYAYQEEKKEEPIKKQEEEKTNPNLANTIVLEPGYLDEYNNQPKEKQRETIKKPEGIKVETKKDYKSKEKTLKKIFGNKVATLVLSTTLVAGALTGGFALTKTKTGKMITSALKNLGAKSEIALEVTAAESSEAEKPTTYEGLLAVTKNATQKRFMKNVYSVLNNYNGTFANTYFESDKDIRAALSFDEVVSLKLAYNDYNKTQLKAIFNGASIRSSQLDRNYKDATLQLMGAHVLETSENPVNMSEIIETKEGQEYYNKMHALFLAIKDADTKEEKQAAAKKFGEFIRANYPMDEKVRTEGIAHADEYKNMLSYKSSGVPMISAFEILCQNYEIDSTLSEKEIEFLNDLGLCNLADENFELAELVTWTSDVNKENPTYDEFRELIIKDLESRRIYVIDDAHRDLSELDAFQEEVNWHFEEQGEWEYHGRTWTTTSTHKVVKTRTKSKTTYKTIVERIKKKITKKAKDEVDKKIEEENKKAKEEAEKKAKEKQEEMQKEEDKKADEVKEEVKKDEEDLEEKIEDANKVIDNNNKDDDKSNDEKVNENDFGDHNVDFDDKHSDENGNLNDSVEDITTDNTGDKTNEDLPDPNETGKKFDEKAPKEEVKTETTSETKETKTESKPAEVKTETKTESKPAEVKTETKSETKTEKSYEKAVDDYVEKQAKESDKEEEKEKTYELTN